MPNPWGTLPNHAPYVLEQDREAIELFNERYPAASPYHIQTQLLPDPFTGSPSANVYLLAKHSSYHPDDDGWHANPAFHQALRQNLTHEETNCPFCYLDERFATSPGSIWWRSRLGSLIEDVGLECVRTQIMSLEWFPYHTGEFRNIPNAMLGQTLTAHRGYAAELVRNAIAANKTIIVMYGAARWRELVPALEHYDKFYTVNNHLIGNISPGNLGDRYDAVLNALRA